MIDMLIVCPVSIVSSQLSVVSRQLSVLAHLTTDN